MFAEEVSPNANQKLEGKINKLIYLKKTQQKAGEAAQNSKKTHIEQPLQRLDGEPTRTAF